MEFDDWNNTGITLEVFDLILEVFALTLGMIGRLKNKTQQLSLVLSILLVNIYNQPARYAFEKYSFVVFLCEMRD